MDKRRANSGEYVINIHNGQIEKVCGVFDDGSVIVGENELEFLATMNSDLLWYEDDYLVIPDAARNGFVEIKKE